MLPLASTAVPPFVVLTPVLCRSRLVLVAVPSHSVAARAPVPLLVAVGVEVLPEFLIVPPLLATGLLAPVDDTAVVLVLPKSITLPPLLAAGLLAPTVDALLVVVLLALRLVVLLLIGGSAAVISRCAASGVVGAARLATIRSRRAGPAVGRGWRGALWSRSACCSRAMVLPEFLTVCRRLFAAWLLAPFAVVSVVLVGVMFVVLPLMLVEVPPVVATAPVPVLLAELFLVLSEPEMQCVVIGLNSSAAIGRAGASVAARGGVGAGCRTTIIGRRPVTTVGR